MRDSLEIVGTGRRAEMILSEFGPYIEAQKGKRLKALLQAHRAEKHDAPTLASLVSAYASLCDLQAELERDIKAGNLKSKEMHDAQS